MKNRKKIIDNILSNQLFKDKPPVLIDIGASGQIFEKWTLIADKSICIAFDADDRDFSYSAVDTSTGYLKMYKFNRIVLPSGMNDCTFYLTGDPHCSSTLKPNTESLKDWVFAPLFKVEKEVTLPVVTIDECLENININYIDWYKVDSQGIDRDIFLSINDDVRRKILAADFEPGILDAYFKENKLSGLLKMLDEESYWISTFDVRKIQRLDPKYVDLSPSLIGGPAWAGITALKEIDSKCDLRSSLLLIVFSLIEGQWGYALQVCEASKEIDPIFNLIQAQILSDIRNQEHNLFFKISRRLKHLGKRLILGN